MVVMLSIIKELCLDTGKKLLFYISVAVLMFWNFHV